MEYVIGIDGGGTKTLLKIADLEGHLLTQYEGGPSNINSMNRLRIASTIIEDISRGLSGINENLKNCRVLCIGTAGIDRPDDKRIVEDIIRDTGYDGETIITNDAVTALYGAVGSGEGIILISGTGSICYGRNLQGEVYRTGGWGHIIGDAGSGYYIGINALNAIMKSYDGREGGTLLTKMVLEYLKLKNPESLIEYVYRSGAGKKQIAGIAKVVDEAYKAGDKKAGEILKRASLELYSCCRTVIDRLGFKDVNVTICVSGSVITKNRYILGQFVSMIKKSYPKAKVSYPKNDAAWGAVQIALNSCRHL